MPCGKKKGISWSRDTKDCQDIARRQRDEEIENEKVACLQNDKAWYTIRIKNGKGRSIQEYLANLNKERAKQGTQLYSVIFLLMLVLWPKTAHAVLLSYSLEKTQISANEWKDQDRQCDEMLCVWGGHLDTHTAASQRGGSMFQPEDQNKRLQNLN